MFSQLIKLPSSSDTSKNNNYGTNNKVLSTFSQTRQAHILLPDELYGLIFSFCPIKVLGRCCQCSTHFSILLNQSQAAIPLWRHFVSNSESRKANDLTVDTLSTFVGDGRHPATIYKLLCKRQLRGEIEIVILSMSGKQLRVTIKLNDDKYTMKQRVRKVQELADGFSLEDFDLVYSRTGQRLGVYGDVKEFSPRSMFNIFRYTATVTTAIIPSLAEFSTSRVAKAAQWTNTLEELVDGGIFQQVLFGETFNNKLLKSLMEMNENTKKRKTNQPTTTTTNNNNNNNNLVNEIGGGEKNEIKTANLANVTNNNNVLSGLTMQLQSMEKVARNLRQSINDHRNNEMKLKYKVESYDLIRKGVIGNSIALINSRANIKHCDNGITKDEIAIALVEFIQACDSFLFKECGCNAWKFGPHMDLFTYHPLIHIIHSPRAEISLHTRFKALNAFVKTIINNIFRKRFIWTSFLSGAFSFGSIASITRVFFGYSMPTVLSSLFTLVVTMLNPYKLSIQQQKVANMQYTKHPATVSKSVNNALKFAWKPLGNVNLIGFSLRTINFKSVLRYGDGAILLLLIQILWKMMLSCLPLVMTASCEELVASTCRLIWYKETSFKYYNLWCIFFLSRISLPDKVFNTLRFKRKYKTVLTHYLDFMLSSICYRVLNQFIPTQVLSMAPLYIYILPVFGLLGIANVY